jgi:heme/copper-type cytochrome/quinol oxidase subunit 4
MLVFKNMKKRFNVELTKIKQVAMVGSVVLLTLNIALTAYPYLAWRGVHPYAGVALVFLLILGLIWLLAHLYMNVLEMYKEQKLAENVLYNPYAVHQFNPFQEVTWMQYNMAVLEALRSITPDASAQQRLDDAIGAVERWLSLGYIPRRDFPPHLQRYYLTRREERI